MTSAGNTLAFICPNSGGGGGEGDSSYAFSAYTYTRTYVTQKRRDPSSLLSCPEGGRWGNKERRRRSRSYATVAYVRRVAPRRFTLYQERVVRL